MKAPPGLVGAALLLWGVSIRNPWLGVLAAIGFEALRFLAPASPRREALIAPVVRTCALLALASLGYAAATQSMPQGLYAWLRWLPLVLLPVASLELLCGGVRLSSLLRALRFTAGPPEEDREIDLLHAYAAVTLAAAGTGTGAQAWLYAGFAGIVAWALLARRPRGRRIIAAALFVPAAALGFAFHVGIFELQGQVEEWSTELFADLLAGKPDPFRERTRIGDLGKIKMSDRIVMRVATEGPRPEALLLRESAFERYRGGEWQSARRVPRPAARQGDRWSLADGPAGSRLTLRRSLPGGEGLLPLPLGSREVANLPAHSVEIFPSGAVRVRGTPRFLAVRVAYDEAADHDAPGAADLEVPAVVAGAFAQVLADEGLKRDGDEGTVSAVRAFFDTRFSYSLQLSQAGESARGRTISDFLLRERKGHCEYFATATVLLLRQAGIPARYVGGYSAQEYSPRETAFVVRARHAHAWAIAYLGGRWVNVDTTPSRWAEFEGEAARGLLAPLLDRLSWLVDRVVQAWLDREADGLLGAAAITFLALVLLPALLLLARKARRRAAARPRAAVDAIGNAWARIEASLARAGHGRAPEETVREWAARLHRAQPGEPWRGRLRELAGDFYRARFDPGAEAGHTRDFVLAAQDWKKPP